MGRWADLSYKVKLTNISHQTVWKTRWKTLMGHQSVKWASLSLYSLSYFETKMIIRRREDQNPVIYRHHHYCDIISRDRKRPFFSREKRPFERIFRYFCFFEKRLDWVNDSLEWDTPQKKEKKGNSPSFKTQKTI